MNSFESDMKRAICNVNFIIALVVECGILCCAGWESELFRVSVPVLSPFPYSTAWLNEYQSGFVKEYVVRCGRRSYIWGKLLACGISGEYSLFWPVSLPSALGSSQKEIYFSCSFPGCSGPLCLPRWLWRQTADMWHMADRLFYVTYW